MTNSDLRVAKYVESGGNCGPGGSWACETVDSAGDVGKFTSIDIYTGTSPFTWKVGISYYDADNYALKYAQYAWSQPLQVYKWTIYTIQSGSVVNKYGQHTLLKFDEAGSPHISYYRSIPPPQDSDALMYAHRVSSGGNCGPSSNWQCDVVDSGSGVGQYTSLILTNKKILIIYYDSGNDQLKFSESGFSYRIDSNAGKYTSAVWDSRNDYVHVAYHDEAYGELIHAVWQGGRSCTSGWHCTTIDAMGTSPHPIGISVAVDANGHPLFAYQDASGGVGSEVLKVASDDETAIIDPGGACTDEGRFVSLDISPSGLAVIAYYESDTCYGTGRLKVAHYPFHAVYLPLVLRND